MAPARSTPPNALTWCRSNLRDAVWVVCTVFVKAQIGPNFWKCDPHAVLYDSTSGLHVGHILALTKSVVVCGLFQVRQSPSVMAAVTFPRVCPCSTPQQLH
jgi:hypothetical protein